MLDPLESAIYKITNARILRYPYPHFFVEDVFPEEFFRELVGSLDAATYAPLQGGYQARVASSDMPECMMPFTDDPRFTRAIMGMFAQQFYDRFPATGRPEFVSEWRFIRDSEGYKIGPHTDAPNKVVSLLFYLQAQFPPDAGEPDLSELLDTDYTNYGTGIYVPKDGQKTCKGGPHHPFEGFSEVWRAPFFSNSCFGFWKTANSWHAVEKIPCKIQRDVLLFNIYEKGKG